MKKNVIIILCCLFAFSNGNVSAKTNNVLEKSSHLISLTIDLGDVSELDSETLDATISEATSNLMMNPEIMEKDRCSVSVTVSVGIVSVSVTKETDCDNISRAVKELLAEVKEAIKEL